MLALKTISNDIFSISVHHLFEIENNNIVSAFGHSLKYKCTFKTFIWSSICKE